MGLSANPATCQPPDDVTVTSITSNSVSFSWSPVSGASYYLVYYVRLSDQATISPVRTNSPSITVSGLSSGYYRFFFATVCESGVSEYVIVDDLLI